MKNIQTIECSRKRYVVQNDLRDWEIDNNNKPIKLINEKYWQMKGYSIDPKDIPTDKLTHISQVKKA